jgi:hypothetical protein
MGGPFGVSQKRATTFVVAHFSLFAFSPTTTNDIEPHTAAHITTTMMLRRPDDSETQRQCRQVHEDNKGDVTMGEQTRRRRRRGRNDEEKEGGKMWRKGGMARRTRGGVKRRGGGGSRCVRRRVEMREEEGQDA